MVASGVANKFTTRASLLSFIRDVAPEDGVFRIYKESIAPTRHPRKMCAS